MYGIKKHSTILTTGHVYVGTLPRFGLMVTKYLLVFAAAGACSLAQPIPEVLSMQSPAYEVASVRASAPTASEAGQLAINGDRFVQKNFSVQQMVYMAYDIPSDDLISNLPQWTRSARFDVQARLDSSEAHETELNRSRMILKALLTDRFQLKSHFETRDRRAYALVVDKHGPKVQKATAADHAEMSIRKGDIHLRAATMVPFVQGISLTAGRPVIDKTELSGLYNIDLKCAPDDLNDTNDAGASLSTVLHDQFGLHLVSVKSPVKVLVIDQVERPSIN